MTETFNRHHVLYNVGDPAKDTWYVQEGMVGLFVPKIGVDNPRDRNNQRAIAVRGPGSYLAIEADIRAKHTHAAIVLTPKAELAHVYPSLPSSLASLDTQFTLSETDGSAVQRVAHWLLKAERAQLDLPRRVIADLTGTRPETLSRALRKMKEAGAIEVSHTELVISDRTALQAFLRP